MLTSDRHVDSLHSDHALQKAHLDLAATRNAGVLDFGDLCDCMGGRYDKRADPKTIRPELRKGDYFDAVVGYNAAFLEPWAPYIIHMSEGNHETAAAKNAETNLTERIAERLKARGSPVVVGSYAGWVRFMFSIYDRQRQSIKLRYTHGYGGGGPVTRGVISTARELVYLPDAEILVSGHIHESYHVTVTREVLLDSGRPILRDTECLRCPGYKDEYTAARGWAVEKGMPPKPKGAWWVRFWLHAGHKDTGIRFEVIRAK